MSKRTSSKTSAGLSLGKIAAHCGVTRKTILRWVNDGHIESYVLPSGHHRVAPAEVVRFLREHNMPVPAELQSTSTAKVLICEADTTIRRHIREILEPQFLIVEATDGIQACLLLGLESPQLLIVDMEVKQAKAPAICQAIRNHSHLTALPIIATHNDVDGARDNAAQAPADHVLCKPFNETELLRVCTHLTARSSHG